MLRYKLLMSDAAEWFGRPLRTIPDADLWRYLLSRDAAMAIERGLAKR